MEEPKFLTELECKEIDDTRWELTADLKYQSRILGSVITVPKGFVTDFASVPRVPIAYMAFGDRAHRESVLHDWGYNCGQLSRRKVDGLFYEAMRARGKKTWVRVGMWLGVRLGGWAAWNSHRKAGHSGLM